MASYGAPGGNAGVRPVLTSHAVGQPCDEHGLPEVHVGLLGACDGDFIDAGLYCALCLEQAKGHGVWFWLEDLRQLLEDGVTRVMRT